MIFGKDKIRVANLEEKLSNLQSVINSINQRGYNMAKVDRLKADWISFAKSFNYDISVGGPAMIARGRELFQNDPYAKNIVRNFRNGILGENGFTLRNKAGEWQQFGNEWKFVLDPVANSMINEMWYRYGVEKCISIEGDETTRSYFGTILNTVFTDGEVFIVKLKGKGYNKYGFTTQLITSDQVDFRLKKDLPNGNMIIMGIEVNKNWKKIAYWFKKNNPKSDIENTVNWSGDYERISAENIIHLYKKETAHQLRGITQFAPVGIRLKMLYGIEEAALTRVRSVANIPWVFEEIPNVLNGGTLAGVGQSKDTSGNQLIELEEGQTFQAPKGYQVKSMEADFPGTTYEPFIDKNLHGISSGVGQGYASVTGDWMGYNYSVSRAALQSERDEHKDNQSWFAEQCVNEIFVSLLEMAILSGQLNLPIAKFDKFNRPYWFGRRWQYANPKDEMESNILGLQSFQKTFEQVLADQGIDLEEQLDQIVSEKTLFEKKGLTDLYNMLMTKYNVAPSQPVKEQTSASGNGNGKAKLLTEFK